MPYHSASDSPLQQIPISLPPQKRIEVAVNKYGEEEVVAGAVSLMRGNNEGEVFLLYVGGEHAQGILDGAPVLYWPELWGTRTLLYVWDDSAIDAVIDALQNPAWRVREMAARVVAARNIPATEELLGLLTDETPRVRIAGAKALGEVGTMEHIDPIKALLKDPIVDVRRGAQQGIEVLRKRFPRSTRSAS